MTERLVHRAWERLAILVAVASLWPWILKWPHPFWRVLLYVMLGVMGVLVVVNVRRIWRMGHPSSPDEDA